MEIQINRGEQVTNDLSLEKIPYHIHNYNKIGNYLVCPTCNKKILSLGDRNENGIRIGIKKNGSNYSVRDNRKRYFFPSEWKTFIKLVRIPHDFYFKTLIHTGSRAMEGLNLKAENFDLERGTVTFETVKHKASKRNIASTGKTRTFFVSENYIKEAKKFIKDIKPKQYLFLNNNELPENYDSLNNKEKKKYYGKKETAYSQMFKRIMKRTGIKDWNNFSLHNLRKTYGNWMRIYDIKTEEILYRLGHDMNTYLAHYGSPMIFTSEEKREIMGIYGEVK